MGKMLIESTYAREGLNGLNLEILFSSGLMIETAHFQTVQDTCEVAQTAAWATLHPPRIAKQPVERVAWL
jgi:hypothetical protein